MRRADILQRKEDILKWIEEKKPKAYMCKELRCKAETLNSYLKKMGITYAGKLSNKGGSAPYCYMTALEYSQTDSPHSDKLKKKLIRDGIKENKCEICGAHIWNGVELSLELHHIDGNHFNNDLDNLQILCPNCHSLQKGNSGNNAGRYNKGD